MISFNLVPGDIRVPGSYVEFDSSKALSGLPAVAQRILVIGQRLNSGTRAALAPMAITSADHARQAFGRGSMLALALGGLKAVNDRTECWAIALDDAVGSAAATGSITVTGTATASGTIALLIAGLTVPVGITSGQTAAQVATAIVAAIGANLDLPVSAAAVGAVVTVTARNKGTSGNDIDVRHSFQAGEVLPAGIGLNIVAMAGGATDPDIGAVWPVIGDQSFSIFILPVATGAAMTSAEQEMDRRAGPAIALDGLAVAGARGTFGTLSALGAARNGRFSSIVGAKASPSHPFVWAAAYYGTVAYHAAIDPARPFQTLRVPGLVAPAVPDRFTVAERELLLRDGISTFTVDADGAVTIERPISTYQTNPQGFDDPSWLDLNVPLLLAYIRRVWRTRYALRFPRHKLANDGTSFAPGQAIVTPRSLKAENVSIYADLISAGLVEDMDGFKQDQLVERDTSDRSRVNTLLPVRLIGQFRVQAAKIEYRL